MIDLIVKNPRELGYNEKERMADDVVEMLSGTNGISYGAAYKVIKAHIEVYEEALSHLNHNASIEMSNKPIEFLLNVV